MQSLVNHGIQIYPHNAYINCLKNQVFPEILKIK